MTWQRKRFSFILMCFFNIKATVKVLPVNAFIQNPVTVSVLFIMVHASEWTRPPLLLIGRIDVEGFVRPPGPNPNRWC